MTDNTHEKLIDSIIERAPKHTDGAELPQGINIRSYLEVPIAKVEDTKISTEFIDTENPYVQVEDLRKFDEETISKKIADEWGETLDTLIPTYIAYVENDKGAVVRMDFESVQPASDGAKVVYQFLRRGTYGKDEDDIITEFKDTEIIRMEIRPKGEPIDNIDPTSLEQGNSEIALMENMLPDIPNLDHNQAEVDGNIITTYRKIL